MMKRHQRISSGRTVTLKSYSVKPTDEEGNHECIFPNPTYQDIQGLDRPVDGNISPKPNFQDAQDDKTINISPNPNFQDAQDNDFSVQLET